MLRGAGLTFLLLIQFLFVDFSVAQVKGNNPSEELVVNKAASVYFKSLGEQSGIYRGTEYTGYPFRVRSGHQYFESADISYGSVFYDGILYEGVPMRYDIVKNEVVVLYPDNVSGIRLHNQKIKYFNIYNHHFIQIGKEDLMSDAIPAGFYDRVYAGEIELLVNRSKGTLKEATSAGNFITILKQKNIFFLRKQKNYFQVESIGSVLKVLGINQKKILDEFKKNKIKFRKDPEKAIVHMLKFKDQLSR